MELRSTIGEHWSQLPREGFLNFALKFNVPIHKGLCECLLITRLELARGSKGRYLVLAYYLDSQIVLEHSFALVGE